MILERCGICHSLRNVRSGDYDAGGWREILHQMRNIGAALNDDEYLQQAVSVNNKGMQQLIKGFTELGLDWIPSVGNFVTVDLKMTALPIYEALLSIVNSYIVTGVDHGPDAARMIPFKDRRKKI